MQRAITGILFVALLVTTILWSYATVAWLFFFVALLGTHEFYKLTFKKLQWPQWIGVVLSGYVALIPFIAWKYDFSIFLLSVPALLFVTISFIYELFALSKQPFKNVAFTLMPLFYIALPFTLLYTLAWAPNYSNDFNNVLILAFFTLVWSNDTFAYLVGRQIGKTKLFEKISPKKTWEGTMGGVVGTVITAVIWSQYQTEIALQHWIAMAVIVAFFGSIGDLVESSLKRSLNVKDSGNILPGHGGILDRFDAVIFAAPIVGLYFYIAYNAF